MGCTRNMDIVNSFLEKMKLAQVAFLNDQLPFEDPIWKRISHYKIYCRCGTVALISNSKLGDTLSNGVKYNTSQGLGIL